MKEINNYSGYWITEDGRVISLKRKGITKELKPQHATKSKKGYYQVRLFNEEGGKLHYVHRLVWETYRGEIPKGLTIDHIDNDTSNNNVDNLKTVTRRANTKKYQNNRPNNLRHKRDELIEDYKILGTYAKVAQKHGVSPSNAWMVINNKVPKTTYRDGFLGYTEYSVD